jgi:tetratricopeptide (TPR) repeat protein
MEHVIVGGDFERAATLKNLVEHPAGLNECLPLLRRAMGDPLKRVRAMARRVVFRLASDLDLDTVGPFEASLAEDLTDLATLTMVLWVYWPRSRATASSTRARQRLVLKTIEQMPTVEIARCSPLLFFYPQIDRIAYERARRLWSEKIDANPHEAVILGGAANFFSIWERPTSIDLFHRCRRVEPDNPEWSRALGDLYSLDSDRKRIDSRKNSSAVLALVEFEHALLHTRDEAERFELHLHIAEAALTACDYDKAQRHAEELLRQGPVQESAWGRGVSIHKGNLMLGRIALVEGNVERAKGRLMSAISVPESPPHLLFVAGMPNMSLAKDLLESGESTVVLDYLRKCAEYSPEDRDLVDGWVSEVESGCVPDFGANLFY